MVLARGRASWIVKCFSKLLASHLLTSHWLRLITQMNPESQRRALLNYLAKGMDGYRRGNRIGALLLVVYILLFHRTTPQERIQSCLHRTAIMVLNSASMLVHPRKDALWWTNYGHTFFVIPHLRGSGLGQMDTMDSTVEVTF